MYLVIVDLDVAFIDSISNRAESIKGWIPR